MSTMFEKLVGGIKTSTSTTPASPKAETTPAAPKAETEKKETTAKERYAAYSYQHAVIDVLFSKQKGIKFHNAETGEITAVPEAVDQEIKWTSVDGNDFLLLKLKNGKRQLVAFNGSEVKLSPTPFDKAKIIEGVLYFEQGGQLYKKELKAPKPANTPVDYTGDLF